MFRPASRALLRAPGVAVRCPAGRRLISTGPSESKSKPRSWKNTAVRLGLAGGAVYYYNTSSYFANGPSLSLHKQRQTESDDSSLPTLDSITPKIREQRTPTPAPATKPQAEAQHSQPEATEHGALKSPQELQEEASQEEAFNPETGEINWDCPCLGGMAHGPCGEDFKAAFSCFVFSTEEPKGMDCIEKFKAMQDCFRQHPDIYGAELEDDEPVPEGQQPTEEPASASSELATQLDSSSSPEEKRSRAKDVNSQVKSDSAEKGELAEDDLLTPKAWHDAAEQNENKPPTKASQTEK